MEERAMLGFPIYPPEDLAKLDQQKRGELKAAIRNVLKTDAEVQKLLHGRPWDTLLNDNPEIQNLLKNKTYDKFEALLRGP
jgi:hypothetical protein